MVKYQSKWINTYYYRAKTVTWSPRVNKMLPPHTHTNLSDPEGIYHANIIVGAHFWSKIIIFFIFSMMINNIS